MDVDGDDDEQAPGPGTGWARLRRPERLVAQTRWLFTLLVTGSAVVSSPGLLMLSSGLPRLLAVGSLLGLVAVWTHRYLTGRASVLLGLTEALLILLTATAGLHTQGVFAFLFASLWLRAVYGSVRGVALHTVLVAAAVAAAPWTWTLLPGRPAAPPASMVTEMLSAVPIMFLTAWAAWYLVRSLFAREQTQDRDAALLTLGNGLMGATDRGEIRRLRDECAAALHAVTPLMQVLAVVTEDGEVAVHHADGAARVPAVLPASVVPAVPGPGASPVRDSRLLAATTGLTGATWLGVPFPDGAGWILLAYSPQVCTESVVAVESMVNQEALALRTSDAHHDLITQAAEDSLTGLANRAAFTAALEAELRAARRRVALLFLDLDDFKLVNDGLGHAAGDELLRRIATRLRSGVRPGDLCARLGGDEFAVILFDADDEAAQVGQRLVELVAAPVMLHGRLAQVGASVGLAHAGPGLSGEQLVHRADIAMYAAKAKGKNRVQVFDPGLLQVDDRAQFEAELAAAAAAGQLVVHYQPVVAVRDGSCVAVEALVRWQHPTRGLLYPAEFVPTAERTGAIMDIGEEVLRRACADGAAWTGPAGPLAVHVNVSAAQLGDPDFEGFVLSCLREVGMEPRRLVLEVTEGMVLDSPMLRAALETFSAMGVTIAVDDFGTGYSALSILRTLPVDIIKIDRSLLTSGPCRGVDEVIFEAVVSMTRRLGLRVVAEGVERLDQQQFLREIGADAAQGNLHLRPTPVAELVEWLAARNAAHRGSGAVALQSLEPGRLG